MAQLLITGGAGFIGSHTCLALLEAGHNLIVLENYSNSSNEALRRVAELAGVRLGDRITLLQGDIRNQEDLEMAFSQEKKTIDAVVHFAGLKAVGESVQQPLRYWDVNVGGTCSLLGAMKRHGCRTIVFSSSATVYGYPKKVPIQETAIVQPISPYGRTKAAVEKLLTDVSESEDGWCIACLRYFNPVGAHSSGRIGESPYGMPNNLFPFVCQVAVGQRKELKIFGGDWPTTDGTPVRDYIHVMDLAEGHCAALEVLMRERPQVLTINLGCGYGYSVLEVVKAFESVSSMDVPFKIVARRPGDVSCSIADSTLAANRLGWVTRRNLVDMCRDAFAWQKDNPFGYFSKND